MEYGCTLSLIGVWSFLIFLVLPFLFFLIVAILVPDLCPHSTSPMYLVWHFINNIFTLSIKKKKVAKIGSKYKKIYDSAALRYLYSTWGE